MWRLALLTTALLVLGTSTAVAQHAPDDFECAPCTEQCEQLGVEPGDRICTAPGPDTERHSDLPRSNFDVHYGVPLYGLTAPDTTTFQQGPTRTTADLDRSRTVIRLHEQPDESVDDDRTRTPIQREDGQPVLRIGDDGEDVEPVDDPVGEIDRNDDETVIRLHQDDEAVDDTETVAEIERTDPDDEAEQIDEIPEFVHAYLDWEFVPVIDVLRAEGAVTDVDVQRTLNADEEGIADCFEPRDYPGHGAMTVDLNLSYNGIVESVEGTTDGIPPNQARCILERAWRYEFPRLADEADEPSQITYQVEFIGQPIDVPAGDPDNPHLFLERVRTSDPRLDEAVADSLFDQIGHLDRCGAQSLDQLPADMVATEVHVGWLQAEPGLYRPALLDATIHNKTSTERPSPRVVDCFKQRLQQMNLELDADDIEDVDELPDELRGSFWVTLRPAGWTGM